MLVATALVHIVMLKKHRGRQHDVRNPGGFGHELFVNTDEQIRPGKSSVHSVQVRGYRHGIGVLYEQRSHRRTIPDILLVIHQYRTDSGLIEHPDTGITNVQPFDQCPIPVIDITIIVKCAATLIEPAPGNRRNRQNRMHVKSAISLSGKSIAQTKEGSWCLADH